MNISTLIAKLEAIKKEHGELEVSVTSCYLGAIDIINAPVESVNLAFVYGTDKDGLKKKVASIHI